MSLKKLEDVDKTTQYLVYGFNRNINGTLGSCKLLEIIPSMIYSLCILYYYEIDTFKIVDLNYLELSDNKKTITKIPRKPYKQKGGFGSIVVPSTVNFNGKWTIKVNSCNDSITIGITSNASKDVHEPLFSTVGGEDIIYSYNGYKGYKHKKHEAMRYGEAIRTGDIIDMHLIIDGDQQRLSFYKNGKNLGVAFDEIRTGVRIQYRFGVTMRTAGDQITITNFKTE